MLHLLKLIAIAPDGTGLLKVESCNPPGVQEFAHRDGSRDESHCHRWRHFAPQAPVGSDPVMDESLHIEAAWQRRFGFGIEVLASPIGTAPSSQGGIVCLIVIGMHLRGGTDGGKRMVDFGLAGRYEVGMHLSERIGSQAYPLPVPAVATSSRERDLWQTQQAFMAVKSLAKEWEFN